MRTLITLVLVAFAAVSVCLGDPLPLNAVAVVEVPKLAPEVKPEVITVYSSMKETATSETAAQPSLGESSFEDEEEPVEDDNDNSNDNPDIVWTVPPDHSPSLPKGPASEEQLPAEDSPASDDSLISANKKPKPTKPPRTPKPSRTTRPPKPHAPAELILVLQWPITFSKEKGNRGVDTGKVKPATGDASWTIHGLWPNNVRCSGKPLKNTDLTPGTKTDLARAWPTYNAGQQDIRFWDYEWKKHGACAGMASPEAYFTTARDHWSTHRQVYQWLEKASIKPHDGNTYATADLVKAIVGGGVLAKDQFALSCITKNGQKWLKEFKVCFEPTGKKLTACPKNIAGNTSTCGKAVHYFQNF